MLGGGLGWSDARHADVACNITGCCRVQVRQHICFRNVSLSDVLLKFSQTFPPLLLSPSFLFVNRPPVYVSLSLRLIPRLFANLLNLINSWQPLLVFSRLLWLFSCASVHREPVLQRLSVEASSSFSRVSVFLRVTLAAVLKLPAGACGDDVIQFTSASLRENPILGVQMQQVVIWSVLLLRGIEWFGGFG